MQRGECLDEVGSDIDRYQTALADGDWDRCERIAAAVARLFGKQTASLETVFGVLHIYALKKPPENA